MSASSFAYIPTEHRTRGKTYVWKTIPADDELRVNTPHCISVCDLSSFPKEERDSFIHNFFKKGPGLWVPSKPEFLRTACLLEKARVFVVHANEEGENYFNPTFWIVQVDKTKPLSLSIDQLRTLQYSEYGESWATGASRLELRYKHIHCSCSGRNSTTITRGTFKRSNLSCINCSLLYFYFDFGLSFQTISSVLARDVKKGNCAIPFKIYSEYGIDEPEGTLV